MNITKEDRAVLKSFRSKGKHSAREINRAHILSALDQKVPEAVIMQVLGVGRTAIWRTRSAFVEKELDYAFRLGQMKIPIFIRGGVATHWLLICL